MMKFALFLALCSTISTSVDGKIRPLIFGGDEQPIGQRTWVTGLRKDSLKNKSICGGALITPTHVLTAAHCQNFKYVAVGTHFVEGTSDGEYIKVRRQIPHPKYNPSNTSYDIMILELEQRVTKFTPVPIAKWPAKVHENTIALGWGVTEKGGLSDYLRKVDLKVVSNEKCAHALNLPIDESMVCAGGMQIKDSCTGDSGGPLIAQRNGLDALVGVISFGSQCGIRGKPGVYSRIASSYDFIATYAPGVQYI